MYINPSDTVEEMCRRCGIDKDLAFDTVLMDTRGIQW